MAQKNISKLGLVGCGGAGFPTHVKLGAENIDALIVNAAECEPLLHKDKEILWHRTEDFLRGLTRAAGITGAKAVYIGLKHKHASLFQYLEDKIKNTSFQMLPMGDFYPAGDEYELVYEATGRLIPFGGIPLNIGCVVINVETLMNLGANKPVVGKWLSLAGAVPMPCTVEVPVGITVAEALAIAGLTDLAGMRVIDGGPMMGKLVENPNTDVVTKVTGGLIALPEEHVLISKMLAPNEKRVRISRSACDQCTDCSELCPRALLGYPIRPHKAMRTAQFAPYASTAYAIDSVFCSDCGLCSYFSCPEDLPPREICGMAKAYHLGNGVKLTDFKGKPEVHPMRDYRRVTVERLIKKLGLLDFDKEAPLLTDTPAFTKVRLPLKMHIGAPATPAVKVGDEVKTGQLLAEMASDKLGAAIHASINGRIVSIDETSIIISNE
jgi:Na+-translocating ferredoxin:NAD+ oxidoreductase RnfC subunit